MNSEKTESDSPTLFKILLTVAGERFSVYGIKALLILYVVKALSFDNIAAGQLFGLFSGLIAATPLLGGYLADRYLGHRRSIILGCALMTIGQVFLYDGQLHLLICGLLIFILGTGLFEPSITAILGWLSPKDGKAKESNYMLYLMAVNAGSLTATLVCAWIATYYSWAAAFMTSTLGTVLGLVLMAFTRLPEHVKQHEQNAKDRKSRSPPSTEDKGRILTIIALAVFGVLFTVTYEQAWSSLMIFAERYTDRHIFGYEFPAPYFQVIDPVIVIVLGLFFLKFLRNLGQRGRKPAEILKMAMGLAFLGACYAVLVVGMLMFSDGAVLKLNATWMLASVFLATVSQFFFIPVGLTLVSKLAPRGYTGLMMGVWSLSFGIGNYIAGALVGAMGNTVRDLVIFFAAQALLCTLAVAILLATNKRFQRRINSYVATN